MLCFSEALWLSYASLGCVSVTGYDHSSSLRALVGSIQCSSRSPSSQKERGWTPPHSEKSPWLTVCSERCPPQHTQPPMLLRHSAWKGKVLIPYCQNALASLHQRAATQPPVDWGLFVRLPGLASQFYCKCIFWSLSKLLPEPQFLIFKLCS